MTPADPLRGLYLPGLPADLVSLMRRTLAGILRNPETTPDTLFVLADSLDELRTAHSFRGFCVACLDLRIAADRLRDEATTRAARPDTSAHTRTP